MPRARSFSVWVLLMVVESIHGALRIAYLAPRIGDLPARRIAVLGGLLLIFLATFSTIRWLRATTRAALLGVGLNWVCLTILFEFALGRLLFHLDWGRILSDYDLSRGGLMGLGLLGMFAMPWVCSRIRLASA